MRRHCRLKPARRVLPALLVAILPIAASAADLAAHRFSDAVRAYDAGDYGAAAAIWHELASDCNPRAQAALGALYRAGLGVARSDVEALRWYLMAAWAGDRFAQQAAGDWYAQGDGVPADRVRAVFWLTLAARQGLAWADVRREALERDLSGPERDELARRLHDFASVSPAMCQSVRK